MCPRCYVKLIPIMYGKLNPELLDMSKRGEIIVGSGKYKSGKPRSFCISCEEAFESIAHID